MLRRLFFLFLAVLLPFQLAWGAVSGYCQHESGAPVRHIGHHEHLHKGDAKKASVLKVAPDNDCGTCHGAGVSALTSPPAPLLVLGGKAFPGSPASRAPPSLPPESPYRPQWPRLA